jgi:SAM-dependent methyltransferase
MDILGKALEDYQNGKTDLDLLIHSSLGDLETLNPGYFFRPYSEMPKLEQIALEACAGTVLDIGCGAGSHSLFLQEKGLEVIGIDRSPGAVSVARSRGAKKVYCEDILNFNSGTFNTLLLLMNGAGIAGTLKELPDFLSTLGKLLRPGGQILLDSSDIIYVYEEDVDGGVWIPGNCAYYGEVTYQWEYLGAKGPEFPWLFVDFNSLEEAAHAAGLEAEIIAEGPHYDYLARLVKI